MKIYPASRFFVLLPMFVLLSACGSFRPVDVAKPSEITVEEGMRQVASGIATMRDTLKERNARPGLIVDEATIVFNVTASSTDTRNLKIDVSRPATAEVIGLNGTASDTLVGTATRGNTITIKLKNAYTAGLNNPGAEAVKYCTSHRDDPDCAFITISPRQR